MIRSLEIFAGAGGQALGVERAGFLHEAVIERDPNACATLKRNQQADRRITRHWNIIEEKVEDFDFRPFAGIDLLSGGPPCQPFSLGGKHQGHRDSRNLFPEMVRAVNEASPKALLIENVKGLLRDSFRDYFRYILMQLRFPEFRRLKDEIWSDHAYRLGQLEITQPRETLTYDIHWTCMNAADFGVPQKRERVFIVGFRSDLSVDWRFPEPTHSFDALLSSQWITGDYWDRHGIRRADRPVIPGRLKQHLRRTNYPLFPRALLPWRTVRDAIGHLPDPRSKEACCIFQHQFNPGARAYKGHTGSPLDEPAKTLKAGDHGVPGGENMLRFSDGSVRYFTVLESLHLQTFPSHFELVGSWSEKMRQLGNAVPVELARVMAGNILGELWRRKPREKRAAVQSA